MGKNCSKNIESDQFSNEYLQILKLRIDDAIEFLPNYIDDIININGFESRGSAIEHAMRLKGFRKITPIEYAEALEKTDENVFIWKKIPNNNFQNTSNIHESSFIETLDQNSQHGPVKSSSKVICISQADTEAWPVPNTKNSIKCYQVTESYDEEKDDNFKYSDHLILKDCDCRMCRKNQI